jgi:serine/threonine-protein kinase
LDEKNFREAEQDFSRVADNYRRAYGDADYRVAVALGNLASVYQKEKRYPLAENLLLDVVQRFTRALGPENIQTGMAQVRLGRNLLYEKKYAQAEAHSRIGYEIISRQMSPDSAWISGARHDLAADFAAMGDQDKARKFGSAPPASKRHDRQ